MKITIENLVTLGLTEMPRTEAIVVLSFLLLFLLFLLLLSLVRSSFECYEHMIPVVTVDIKLWVKKKVFWLNNDETMIFTT